MADEPRTRRFAASLFFPIAAIALAIAIFVIDTATPLEAAVAVLYVVVVMLSSGFMARRGLLLVSYACIVLTVLSYLLQHGLVAGSPLIRSVMSISAIAITTFLALRYQTATIRLREQARLL